LQQAPKLPTPELVEVPVHPTLLAWKERNVSTDFAKTIIITYHAVNELEITGALRVAVSSSVLGTRLVGGVLGHATIKVHLGEVDGTVQTAGQVRDIHIHSVLRVDGLEVLVLGVGLHEVDTRADILVGARGDELEGEGVAAGGNAVGAGVVSTVQSAVGGAGGRVGCGTENGVELVSGVAIGRASGGMEPAPIGIEDNLAGLVDASTGDGALLPGEGGVSLSGQGADLLSRGVDEEDGKGKKS